MSRLQLITIFLVLLTSITAQRDTSHLFSGISARSIGPAGMSGRVTAIDVERKNPAHIIIGSASGGVWESKNGGVSWKPIFDDQPSLSIGAVKIDQSNPDVIWVGTGEGNPRNSHNSGAGLFKSIDGGKTWINLGMTDTRLIHRILIDPTDSEIVYVGAMGSAWGDSQERGVFKTMDGGKTWKKILYVNPSTGVGEMVMDPTNPNKLLVNMWDFRRTPWDFRSGGPGSGLYMTHDGGETWKKLKAADGLPKGTLGRMGLAFATNKPDIVYALIEAKTNGLYKSTDGGHSWNVVSTKNIGNRPFYYSEIYVDPSNENRIFNLWSYVSLSEDGGRSFETIMDYGNSIHPDHHAFYIHPDNPNFLINGNDGGLNLSYDGGKTWTFAGNLPIGQFYHINYDTAFPYNIYGGMQDNGSWVGPHKVLRRGGIRNDDWQELYFGDGFDVVPQLSNPRFGYAMSQGGNVARYDRQTGSTKFIKPVAPGGQKLRFSWNAAIAADPDNDCGIYFGSQYVHYSKDCGESWDVISPDLTTNDSTRQQQHLSGGLTKDVTQAENHTTILCIAPSSHDNDVIWVGSDDGLLHLTRDGGKSWIELAAKLPGYSAGSWIPQIEIGNRPGEAFVVVNDYRRNDFTPYLYYTKDYGQTFSRLADGSEVDGFVCSVVQDDVEGDLLFLGTDVGLYYSLDRGGTWEKWNNTVPNVQIRDLKIQPQTNDLILGTFGRAIWVIDDISFMRQLVEEEPQNFELLSASDGLLTESASYQGVRFYAQGQFIGDNDSRGVATITYHYRKKTEEGATEENGQEDEDMDETDLKNEEESSDNKKSSKSKAEVTIKDDAGEVIRTFETKVKEGINRLHWNLREDGVRGPSRNIPKDDDPMPSGRRVEPGKYLIKVCYASMCDSSEIEVHPDPRVAYQGPEDDLRDAYDEIDRLFSRNHDLMNDLNLAGQNVKRVSKMWDVLADSVQQELKEEKKSILKTIDSLSNLFVGEKNTKGYIDRSELVTTYLYRARSYVYSAEGSLGENGRAALEQASRKTTELAELVESFFDEDWRSFREKVEEAAPPLFREF